MVMLNAAVTPPTAVGAVQFKDGTDNIGNPITLSNGTASGTTSRLAAGSRQLSAVFTPTDPAAFSMSTSPTVTFMVTASPATSSLSTGPAATNTVLTASSTSITQGNSVTLTAMVTPPAAAGTVQFKDGMDNLGSPVTVSNSTASVTAVIQSAGARQLTAEFTPANTSTFSPSKSPPLSLTVIQSQQTVTQQAQQSGQSLDGSSSLDGQGLTVLDLGGLGDGGGIRILDGGGNVGGGLTILDLGGRNDGRGLLDGGGLTLLRSRDGDGGGLISDLLNALL